MFRGTLPGAGASGSAEDRLESLKRQYNPDDGSGATAGAGDGQGNGNGLSMNLQDQYDHHDEQQAAKRQRGMGMGMGDFGQFGPGAGMGAHMGMNMNMGPMSGMAMANAPGGGGMGMGGLPGMNGGGAGGNPMGGAGNGGTGAGAGGGAGHAGMNGMMNPMAGAGGGGGAAGAGGMNGMAGAGMNPMGQMSGAGMNSMNGMAGAGAGMNGAMNAAMGGPMGGAGGMGSMGQMAGAAGAMNSMNMARAGMLQGGAGGAGFPHLNAAMDNDIAAALYFGNNFEGPGAGMGAGMGLLGQRGAGLGFAAMAQGMGGFGGNPFGDYGRLAAQNPYLTAGMGLPGGPGGGPPGSAAANAMAGGAGMGLPGSNARRAQLMALMDMENELQQQQEAAKVGSSSFPGANAASSAGGPQDFMAAGQRGLNGLGGATAVAGRGRDPQDADGLTQSSGPTQIPEPPMDIPTFSTASTPSVLPLPPVIEEGAAPHYSQRAHIPLGIDEDNNWLTEFQCFIRFDLIEVVQASRHVDQMNAAAKNGGSSSGGETFQQVGVRCRYCAHLHPGQRASRSSAFPSSIRQLYQSFTMMLRDHFEQCSEIPPLRKKLFSELKAKNSQGAYDSKQYWIYAAEKLGMIDSEHGIQMTADSQAKARRKPPFGTVGSTPHTHAPPKLLVSPEDIRITSDFLYTLMSQVQVVHLIDSERVGKRKTLRVGLPGFGCRYCCHVGRCGLSRMFPLRRRMLPGKVNEIYEHVKRCTLFPTKEKELLARLKNDDKTSPEQEKEFFDRIWERLGCESEVKK